MLRIEQMKLKPGHSDGELLKKAAKILKTDEKDIRAIHIAKRSLDARKKPELFFSYVIDVEVSGEEKVWKRCDKKLVSKRERKSYVFPTERGAKKAARPVVVGMGPAGLFCAYFLAREGYKPILLERGKDVDARNTDVESFWQGGALNPESNVQFGEGGAGTFSDGKLNTLVKDKYGRNGEVLRILQAFGAPAEILYESKPHIGTDILKDVVKNMRMEIIRLGGEVRFESQVTDICIENHKVCGVVINGAERLAADIVVLAIGHSARNTFEMLYTKQIPMEAKPFAVGLRVEHAQAMINESQYGEENPKGLSAASYKVTAKASDGRGVYSFCMCPGGYVVNASSEEGRLCVNGMSYSGRNGKNANSAIIVTVTPADYGEEHPLAGIAFQRKLEERAFMAGGGKVPVQTYGSFKACVERNSAEGAGNSSGTVSDEAECSFSPSIKGEYVYADITGVLPKQLNRDIVEGMEQFAKSITGFNRPDTLLSAVEGRTSSPVRILRNEELQSEVAGLYPCGEGAGYAGGITSAAMDGIKVAEAIACRYSPTEG